jgi:hypothetical protein
MRPGQLSLRASKQKRRRTKAALPAATTRPPPHSGRGRQPRCRVSEADQRDPENLISLMRIPESESREVVDCVRGRRKPQKQRFPSRVQMKPPRRFAIWESRRRSTCEIRLMRSRHRAIPIGEMPHLGGMSGDCNVVLKAKGGQEHSATLSSKRLAGEVTSYGPFDGE